jgi:hypothetical protein
MYRTICLLILITVNSIIGINFYFEYLDQLRLTYNPDGIRLIAFLLPFYISFIILFAISIHKKDKTCALICFINGLLQILVLMNKPKHIPFNEIILCCISVGILIIALIINKAKKKVEHPKVSIIK